MSRILASVVLSMLVLTAAIGLKTIATAHHSTVMMANGGDPVPQPPMMANGGDPVPQPPTMANGGDPVPQPPL